VIEDFYDSISDLKYVWITHGVLAILFGASWLWGGDNRLTIVFSLSTAVAIYAMQQYGDLVKQLNVALLATEYLVAIAAEFLIAGFPDPLLPHLTVENGWIGTIPFLNSLTPFLYYGVRVLFVFYLLQIVWLRYQLAAQPMSIIRLVDRQLAMRL